MHYDRKTVISLSILPLLAIPVFMTFMWTGYPKEALSSIKFFNTRNEASIKAPVENYSNEIIRVADIVPTNKFESESSANVAAPTATSNSVVPTKEKSQPSVVPPIEEANFQYVLINDSCDYKYEGKDCVEAYNEPRPDVPPVARFREGIVLRIEGEITYDGMTWYKVSFQDQTLHHPERLINDWYVRDEDVEIFYGKGAQSITKNGETPTEKRIVVDLSEQKMYAYNGEALFMEASVSTGLELASTPLGEHTVFAKMPSRYMQGPNPDVAAFYDLPGVPWNLYFTTDGAVIHGAYWHESFGTPYSKGCINMTPEESKKLYDWTPLGTKVLVQE